MALTERYFATAAAGDGTGTGATQVLAVANAAALFDGSGNWSTVITGFNFNSTDGLRCRIMPGAYTCAQTLIASLWTGGGLTAPTATLPLILHGADANGELLTPPDPNWQSCQPAFDTSAGWDSTDWPVIATTAPNNIFTISLAHTHMRLLKCTASGKTTAGGIVGTLAGLDWVVLDNSTADADTIALYSGFIRASNSVIACSGSAYSSVALVTNGDSFDNVRVVGGGSSGDRHGVLFTGTTVSTIFSRMTIVGNGGCGWKYSGTNAGVNVYLWRCAIANNGSDGIQFPNTATQTNRNVIDSCLITGNSGYGINPSGANTNLVVTNCRLRDNNGGGTGLNFGTFGNYPTDMDNLVTDSDDATEYVNVATGDYRVKYGSSIWGKGYGVADEVPPLVKKVTMTGGI